MNQMIHGRSTGYTKQQFDRAVKKLRNTGPNEVFELYLVVAVALKRSTKSAWRPSIPMRCMGIASGHFENGLALGDLERG